MLIQILTDNPRALVHIVERTPGWVGILLLALLALGVSQMFRRRASLTRVCLMPAAMLGLSIYGMVSAFGPEQLGGALTLWLLSALSSTGLALWWRATPPLGARFDAAARSFDLPGSAVPMALILGIFIIKYIVGVELAMQSALAHDRAFALAVATLYGALSGLFAARTLRLWRLTRAAQHSTVHTRQAAN